MSLITIGTVSTAALNAIVFGGPSTTAQDIGAINAGIMIGRVANTASQTGFTAAVPSSSNTLTSVSSFANVSLGLAILGQGILPGTFIIGTSTTASTITLSQNTSSAAATTATYVCAPPGSAPGYLSIGLLQVPGHGSLTVFANDVIAVDPQTGWPILLSKPAAAATNVWTHT